MADPHRTKPDSEYSVATTHTQGRDVSTVYITPAEWERRNNPNNRPQPKASTTAPTAPAERPRDPNSGLSIPSATGMNHLRQQGYFADGGMIGMRPPTGGTFVGAAGYADGGQVGMAPQGSMQPGGAPGQPLSMEQLDGEIGQLMQNPQAKAEIQAAIQEEMASGDLTPQELQMMVQLAKAAQMNPQIWPQLRQFVIQQGLAGPEDIPPNFDQGLVAALLIAGQAVQDMPTPQQPGVMPPAGMGQGPQMQGPGLIQGPGTGTSDSISAENRANGGQVGVSTGEYIIPADVVQKKGVDFFDGIVRKYHQPAGFQK